MAGRLGFSETEAKLIRAICQPNNCIYSRSRTDKHDQPRCGTKYAEEAVLDFAGDGCMTAAIPAAEGDRSHVIPGTMTREGFTAFPGVATMTRRDHQERSVSEMRPADGQSKVVFRI